MLHARARHLFRHFLRFLAGNIGICGSMNHEGRRITLGNIANGAIVIEPLRFAVGIVAGDLFWPETVLAAVQIESAALVGLRWCSKAVANIYSSISLFLGDPRLLQVELVGLGQPRRSNIAIAPKNGEHAW